MAFPWILARFLFKVVAPTVPEVVAAVSKLKKQHLEEELDREHTTKRVAELESALLNQVQVAEELTKQLVALEKIVSLALWFAIGGLVLALVVLGVLLFR